MAITAAHVSFMSQELANSLRQAADYVERELADRDHVQIVSRYVVVGEGQSNEWWVDIYAPYEDPIYQLRGSS